MPTKISGRLGVSVEEATDKRGPAIAMTSSAFDQGLRFACLGVLDGRSEFTKTYTGGSQSFFRFLSC